MQNKITAAAIAPHVNRFNLNFFYLMPHFLAALHNAPVNLERVTRYAEALTIHLLHFECEQL